MNETPNKQTKFRNTPLGKYIFDSEIKNSNMDAYTLALLNCENSDQLNKSYGLSTLKKPRSRKVFSVPRGISLPNRDEISVYWQKIEVDGWKPETRQESSLSCLGNSLYLIGGISRSINKDVNIFKISKKVWIRAENCGDFSEPRFGHSAVKYDKKIIVYGGGTHYDTKHKLRECLNGVLAFNTEEIKWEYLKAKGTYLPARKYHSAVMVGFHMFVYGGMNQWSHLLSDPAVLNMNKSSWKSVDINGSGPGKISFHTSTLVYKPDLSKTDSIYSTSTTSSKAKFPGIYFFGGLNENKTPTDSLHILRVGKRPLEWISPRVSGRGPSPRFLHTTAYNTSLNVLIIFGGRVDQLNTPVYTCFNDVFLLDTLNFIWLRVKVIGDVPLGRSGHCAETIDRKMFVFGGVTNTSYCSGDIWTLELDHSAVISLAEMFMRKLEHQNAVETYRKSLAIEPQSKNLSRSRTRRFTSMEGVDN